MTESTVHNAGTSHDRVLILDFGSQVTQLIARRVRECGVYCEIWPYNTDPVKILAYAPRAIILSGGPASVPEGNSPRKPGRSDSPVVLLASVMP